jgi:hypothetical protein
VVGWWQSSQVLVLDIWPIGLEWQVLQLPDTDTWSTRTFCQLPGTWQSSQVLVLDRWTTGLLWQVLQLPDTEP